MLLQDYHTVVTAKTRGPGWLLGRRGYKIDAQVV